MLLATVIRLNNNKNSKILKQIFQQSVVLSGCRNYCTTRKVISPYCCNNVPKNRATYATLVCIQQKKINCVTN